MADYPLVLYHYTCEYHLPAILRSGYLSLSASNFNIEKPNLYPVVWLTDSPVPDNHGLKFDPNIPADLDKTRIRFTISWEPL